MSDNNYEIKDKGLSAQGNVHSDLSQDKLLYDKLTEFSDWLYDMSESYDLDYDDISDIIRMLRNGYTVEQLTSYASHKQQIHRQLKKDSSIPKTITPKDDDFER